MHSAVSSNHLRTAMGWRPAVSLVDGIRELLVAADESRR
jgi:hypothetical protein